MKRRSLIYAMLPLLFAAFAFQSCSKDEATVATFNSFTAPKALTPADGALIKITGTSTELKWETTDADGDAIKAIVYFGMDEDPAVYKTDHNSLNLTVPVAEGNTYYWKVKMTDNNNVSTTSEVFHFSVAVYYDIANFVGAFQCDEPGYGKYTCNLTKIDDSTVRNDNFWDSGWAVDYVFDSYGNVTIVPVSYTSGTTTYDIEGEGKFDNKNKTFYVDYVVTNHATHATIDSNTHTFVKQ